MCDLEPFSEIQSHASASVIAQETDVLLHVRTYLCTYGTNIHKFFSEAEKMEN